MEDVICKHGSVYVRSELLEKENQKNDELINEISRLAIESIEREKQLAKLEAEVLYIKKYVIE